ncbi:MAG: magnesium transporter [Clostridiaceae bacterium]|jgi:magnesium transporter|nr:magnesium transporter [Clostridiaceae bacterium]
MDYKDLDLLTKGHPLDIARMIENADPDRQFDLLNQLPLERMNAVFIELSDELALSYIDSLPVEKKKALLNTLEMDEVRNLLEDVESAEAGEMLSLLAGSKQQKMIRMLEYDEDCAASLMTTDFMVIQEGTSIADATGNLIKTVKDSDFIDELFVVDSEQKYLGSIELKNLLAARKGDKLDQITELNQTVIYEHDTVHTAIQKLRDYDDTVMPVLNEEEHLIGIITADDILDIMIDEYEENVERLVAIGDYEEDSSALVRSKQRLPWLLASIILNLVIAAFLSLFQNTIEQITALVLFQPMILGMAGNIGTQAIAVTILGLHHDKLGGLDETKNHIRNEVMIGLLNSLIVGFFGFIISFVFLSFVNMGSQSPFYLAIVVGSSLAGGMFISAICGVFIPIALDRMKVDPAVASGPIISTINDLFALVVYFAIATAMLL